MIKSMTGFGRGEITTPTMEITVEIRSVNHRYFEFSAKTPRSYGFLDDKLKNFLQTRIARGKVEAYVQIKKVGAGIGSLQVNRELLHDYVNVLRELCSELNVKDDLSATSLLRIPEAFDMQQEVEEEETVVQEVLSAAEIAVDRFTEMRMREGENLKKDVLERLANIEQNVGKVETNTEQTLTVYRNRLYAKIHEVLGDRTVDDQRVLTEVAIFADRIAVDEETVRLRSHIQQMRAMLEETVPVGRKLDFLIQEFNREANTIGSKAQNTQTAQIVVEIKADIEKIREQIQNIE